MVNHFAAHADLVVLDLSHPRMARARHDKTLG